MSVLPHDITTSKTQKVGTIIDHLVDALGSEPACTLRRAVVLADIDESPGTTQVDIMARLSIGKSALNRDIEWLYDYGCLHRQQSFEDKRVTHLYISSYSKENLNFCLEYFDSSHKSLKNFIIGFINLFGQHKPTLRDAKIVASLGNGDIASKQGILGGLYNGPTTTGNRAINNLVDLGIVRKQNEKDSEQDNV